MQANGGASPASRDFGAIPALGNEKGQLRFILCGSAAGGKSTLLGRLLDDSGKVLEDHFTRAGAESRMHATQGDAVDLACRYFETDQRQFIAVDPPGHGQSTRNMVTGASTAELALMVVDAPRGILNQTRRHSCIVSLMGAGRVVLAVNKMDLVDYDPAVFRSIVDEYDAFARKLGIEVATAVPLSALTGENVLASQGGTPWYEGPTLMEILETVDTGEEAQTEAFRHLVF